MKIRFSMKTPDVYDDALKEASGLAHSTDDTFSFAEEQNEHFHNQFDKYFKYGEYVDLELDTETGTVVVIPWK